MNSRLARLLTLSVAIALAGCGKDPATETPAATGPAALPIPASSVSLVEKRMVRPSFSYPGVIEALQQALVRPEVSARLIATHFSAGDVVEKGALLVELDQSQFQADLDAAKADLQSAEANALQNLTNWERAEELKPQGYISDLDYDKAVAALSVAKAAVARARSRVVIAELDLEHTRIYAPFRGRISKPRHAVGNFVQPTGKPLFELVQLDPIYASASVDLGVYNAFVLRRDKWIREGREIPELELRLELAGAGTYPHVGTFENWSHQSDDTTGMIKGRALFPNPDGLLLPGQVISLLGQTIQSYERLMVPQMAVLQDQQGHYVMVLDDDDTVRRRNIEVGVRDGADWAVIEGLEPGSRVIREGAQMLRAGTQVALQAER
jgi:RND family efflux transporter MFP subunit